MSCLLFTLHTTPQCKPSRIKSLTLDVRVPSESVSYTSLGMMYAEQQRASCRVTPRSCSITLTTSSCPSHPAAPSQVTTTCTIRCSYTTMSTQTPSGDTVVENRCPTHSRPLCYSQRALHFHLRLPRGMRPRAHLVVRGNTFHERLPVALFNLLGSRSYRSGVTWATSPPLSTVAQLMESSI